MKKTLTVKNMIKAYYESNLDRAVWEAFLTLRYNGFITEDEWKQFYDTCKAWTWDFDHSRAINFKTHEPIKL